jgi:hypothetical protein
MLSLSLFFYVDIFISSRLPTAGSGPGERTYPPLNEIEPDKTLYTESERLAFSGSEFFSIQSIIFLLAV